MKALVPVEIPRERRSWKLFASDPTFGATKERVFRLVREEVSAGEEFYAPLVIPTGWRFQFRAAPDAELRYVCYTAPPWPGAGEALPAEQGALGLPTV